MSFIMRKKKKYGANTDGRISYILRLLGDSSLKTKSDKVTDAINELADMIYPVGSIYMSVNDVNPAILFGGTWEAWGSGKVPVGVDANDTAFDTVEETGGAKSESYTPAGSNSGGSVSDTKLTAAQSGVPAHSHTMTQPAFSVTGGAVTNGITGGSHTHALQVYNAQWYNAVFTSIYAGGTGRGGFNYNESQTQQSRITSTTHTHNLPSHTHTVTRTTDAAVKNNTAAAASQAHGHGFTNPTFSGTQATISHLQPYITCYMWKRVS